MRCTAALAAGKALVAHVISEANGGRSTIIGTLRQSECSCFLKLLETTSGASKSAIVERMFASWEEIALYLEQHSLLRLGDFKPDNG
jgi:hypothetical protein